MWRKMWFRTGNEARGVWHGAEFLDAGWSPSQEPARVATESKSATEQAADAAAFLARVYTYQQC